MLRTILYIKNAGLFVYSVLNEESMLRILVQILIFPQCGVRIPQHGVCRPQWGVSHPQWGVWQYSNFKTLPTL